jgi:hypothetical protein
MVTNNDPDEIIAECNSRLDPKSCLELYIWYLCKQLEYKDERIKWLQEQLKRA